MNKKHLAMLWKWLCLGCFVYVVGSVITIQGGIDIFGSKFLADAEKDGVAVVGYFAVIVGSCLMFGALIVAILYAMRHGRAWHSRIPVVMLDGLRTASVEGRLYQIIVVLILVILPLVGIGRSMVVANQGAICEQTDPGEPPVHYAGGQWRLIFLPSAENQLRLMSKDTEPGDCGGSGVEIAWYTPLGFGLMPGLVVILLLIWLYLLLRPAPKNELTSSERVKPHP
ncbi:hypothetical protein N185_16440 [Sinorhizobium sp. GW3]|nr:hypothetical protein N185_16440 [Sinorhizobium sp. GW3]